MLAFITPPLIVILVGQLSVRPPATRLLITGAPAEGEDKSFDSLQAVLRELPGIKIDVQAEKPIDPIETARRQSYDLVVVRNGPEPTDITVYTADTEPKRVAGLVELAARMERTLKAKGASEQNQTLIKELDVQLANLNDINAGLDQEVIEEVDSQLANLREIRTQRKGSRRDRAIHGKKQGSRADKLDQVAADIEEKIGEYSGQVNQVADNIKKKIQNPIQESEGNVRQQKWAAAGIIPPQSLYVYYPRARERSAAFLPMTICLVLCFFPFIVAATALVREKESHSVEILLTAPGMTHNRLFAAKCCLPILIAMFDAVLMFTCAEFFYQYYFKSGLLLLGMYVLLAVSAATFLGIAISALVRSTIQAAAASGLYFVCLLLFSGFFIALDQSAGIVRLIANGLPLATLDQVTKASMFGGQLPSLTSVPAQLLYGQVFVFGIIAWLSYRRVFVNRL
jgi:ABC-type Na+ efflux pump permease subunit